MPERIQRKRAKGWRMPEGAVYVGRPTRFGNPFTTHYDRWGDYVAAPMSAADRKKVVDQYRDWVGRNGGPICCNSYYYEPPAAAALARIRGHDLACWCPLDQPCHADVLLEIANP